MRTSQLNFILKNKRFDMTGMVEMRESSVLGHLLFSKLEDEGEQRTFPAFLYSGYFLSLFDIDEHRKPSSFTRSISRRHP